MIALLVLSMVLAPESQETRGPRLEHLARKAAPIAIVRIERIHVIEQVGKPIDPRLWPEKSIRVAEAVLEQRLLGNPAQERVFFALRRPGAGGEAHSLEAGTRALVFLDGRWRLFWHLEASDRTRRKLEQLTAALGPTLFLDAGVWPVDDSGPVATVSVPDRLDPLPEGVARIRDGDQLPLSELLSWLDLELDRVTPTLDATEVSTGVAPWMITIEPDGRWHGTEIGRLEPRELEALWRFVDDQRLDEMPQTVGRSRAPCETCYQLCLRRRDGVHRVDIFPMPLETLADASSREHLKRAVWLWNALPGEKRPQLRN